MEFAIVGCGRMGRHHSERLHADGRGRVAALVDSDRASAVRLRDTVAPAAPVFSDVPELLRAVARGDLRLDAAVICTPTPAHFDQASALMKAGVSVLCEKPLADSRAKIERLVALHRAGPARLAVAYQRRSQGAYRALRREVLSGNWGPVRAVASHNVEAWQAMIGGTWRDDPRINWGGFVGDAGSHKIDIAFFVTGLRPIEVFARTDHCGSRVEITASVSALLEGRVPLTMNFVGNAQYLGEDLCVHCAEADWMLRHGELWLGRAGTFERREIPETDSDPVLDFLELLTNHGAEVAPPDCALPVFDFTNALLTSARTALPVSVPARLAEGE